jgi:hypothetical protein
MFPLPIVVMFMEGDNAGARARIPVRDRARLARRKVGPSLLVLVAAGAGCTAFRTDYGSAGGGGPETWNGPLHAVGFTILVPAALASMFVLAAQFRRVEPWRLLSRTSLLAGLAATACAVAFLAGAGNLFWYVFLAVLVAWLALVAARAVSLSP